MSSVEPRVAESIVSRGFCLTPGLSLNRCVDVKKFRLCITSLRIKSADLLDQLSPHSLTSVGSTTRPNPGRYPTPANGGKRASPQAALSAEAILQQRFFRCDARISTRTATELTHGAKRGSKIRSLVEVTVNVRFVGNWENGRFVDEEPGRP